MPDRMNVDDARLCIGRRVTYHGHKKEFGEITSVGPGWNGYVFVRYDGDTGSKGCRPEDLSLDHPDA